MAISRFTKGGAARLGGVYRCRDCGKLTRDTGAGEASVELCAYCYECAGWENMLQDGHVTEAEYDQAIADLGARYHRTEVRE